MKVTFTVPDELYDIYLKQAKHDPKKVTAEMKARLERYALAGGPDRPLILTGDHRRALEDILETTIDSAEEIVTMCQRLSRINLGEVVCDFSVSELETMQQQAQFMGETMEEYFVRHAEDFRRYIAGVS